jgi:hypothetical protein
MGIKAQRKFVKDMRGISVAITLVLTVPITVSLISSG